MAQQQQLNQIADELEQFTATVPKSAAPGTSIISDIQNLITALRAGDYLGIVRGVRDVLNHLLGEAGGQPRIVAMQAAGNAKGAINWGNLLSILAKLLPLILAFVQPAPNPTPTPAPNTP